MLAVALVPLVIMTAACLLERLEARAVPGEGTRVGRRAAAPMTATTVRAEQDAERPAAVPDAVPAGRHLRLLPSLAGVTGTARATVASAADTLRRAS